MKIRLALVPAALLAIAVTAYGDDPFYCGEHIIEDGMNKDLVAEYCGQPATKEGDHWVYNQGEGDFLVIVHFDGDEVSLIEQVPKE